MIPISAFNIFLHLTINHQIEVNNQSILKAPSNDDYIFIDSRLSPDIPFMDQKIVSNKKFNKNT